MLPTHVHMATIDAAYFPHIIDSIVEYAEFEALLCLRLACRALYKRIDDEWAHLQWNIARERKRPYCRTPDVVYNKRGALMPKDSPCLRLTKVVDLNDQDGDAWEVEIPDHFRPEIIRFLGVGDYPMIAHAKTVMCFDYSQTYEVSDAIHRPAHDPFNIIFRLHIPPTAPHIYGTFCGLGNFGCHADIYLLLSGVDPSPGSLVMDLLCESILYSFAGEENVKERKINFYLVDTPSWFDGTCTALSNEDPRRFDNIMVRHDIFESYLLDEWYTTDCEGNPSSLWDKEKAAARKRMSQVHFITGEEMRQLVGDKVYGLTFAPPVHPASAPTPEN